MRLEKIKKTLFVLVLVLFLWFTKFFDAIVAFFLAGAIPFLNISIPPIMMLFIFGILIFGILFNNIWTHIQTYRYIQKENLRKSRMPKRRYSQISL